MEHKIFTGKAARTGGGCVWEGDQMNKLILFDGDIEILQKYESQMLINKSVEERRGDFRVVLVEFTETLKMLAGLNLDELVGIMFYILMRVLAESKLLAFRSSGGLRDMVKEILVKW